MISAVSGVPRTRAAKLRNPGIPPAGVSLVRDLEAYRVAEAFPKAVAAHPGSGPAFSRILYVIASQGLVSRRSHAMPADAAKISLDPVIFCTVTASFGKGWIQKRATRGAQASRKLRRLCRDASRDACFTATGSAFRMNICDGLAV